MSNPFPSQIREALKNLPIHTEDILPEVFQAATFFSDRYRDCDECGGSGNTFDRSKANLGYTGPYAPCPSCLGGGAVPTDESVEVVARVLHDNDHAYTPPYWDDCTEDMQSWYRSQARAALIALYMMEK